MVCNNLWSTVLSSINSYSQWSFTLTGLFPLNIIQFHMILQLIVSFCVVQEHNYSPNNTLPLLSTRVTWETHSQLHTGWERTCFPFPETSSRTASPDSALTCTKGSLTFFVLLLLRPRWTLPSVSLSLWLITNTLASCPSSASIAYEDPCSPPHQKLFARKSLTCLNWLMVQYIFIMLSGINCYYYFIPRVSRLPVHPIGTVSDSLMLFNYHIRRVSKWTLKRQNGMKREEVTIAIHLLLTSIPTHFSISHELLSRLKRI